MALFTQVTSDVYLQGLVFIYVITKRMYYNLYYYTYSLLITVIIVKNTIFVIPYVKTSSKSNKPKNPVKTYSQIYT